MSWGRGRRGVAEGCALEGPGPRGARCRGPEGAPAPRGVARCSREPVAAGDFSFPKTANAEPGPQAQSPVRGGYALFQSVTRAAGGPPLAPGVRSAEGLDRVLSTTVPGSPGFPYLESPHPLISLSLGPLHPSGPGLASGRELATLPASAPTPLVKITF